MARVPAWRSPPPLRRSLALQSRRAAPCCCAAGGPEAHAAAEESEREANSATRRAVVVASQQPRGARGDTAPAERQSLPKRKVVAPAEGKDDLLTVTRPSRRSGPGHRVRPGVKRSEHQGDRNDAWPIHRGCACRCRWGRPVARQGDAAARPQPLASDSNEPWPFAAVPRIAACTSTSYHHALCSRDLHVQVMSEEEDESSHVRAMRAVQR